MCNVPDFYQFLIYYCHQIINLQFINGTFVAFPKHMGYMGYPNNQPMYYQNYQYGNNPYANNQGHFMNNQNQFGAGNQNFYYPPPPSPQHGNRQTQGHQMHNQYDKNNQFNYGNGVNNFGNGYNIAQNNYNPGQNNYNYQGNYQNNYLPSPPVL